MTDRTAPVPRTTWPTPARCAARHRLLPGHEPVALGAQVGVAREGGGELGGDLFPLGPHLRQERGLRRGLGLHARDRGGGGRAGRFCALLGGARVVLGLPGQRVGVHLGHERALQAVEGLLLLLGDEVGERRPVQHALRPAGRGEQAERADVEPLLVAGGHELVDPRAERVDVGRRGRGRLPGHGRHPARLVGCRLGVLLVDQRPVGLLLTRGQLQRDRCRLVVKGRQPGGEPGDLRGALRDRGPAGVELPVGRVRGRRWRRRGLRRAHRPGQQRPRERDQGHRPTEAPHRTSRITHMLARALFHPVRRRSVSDTHTRPHERPLANLTGQAYC